MTRRTLRIGSGAGFAGDRLEPATVLAARGGLQWLGLECLAERTIALAQLRRLNDPAHGYDPLLERRFEALLPVAHRNGVRIVTNMGAANPVAAARSVAAMAKRRGLAVRVAAVTGDDVLAALSPDDRILETGGRVADQPRVVSANAYLGASAILPAIEAGADVIVTGRVADPALFLAPAMFEHGWDAGDWDRLAAGTVMGHLLECAGQVTGGYYADPGPKDVPGMAQLGFPFADLGHDGSMVISKPDGTGGVVNRMTVKEQLLYEVTDPRAYMTPDVVADFTGLRVREVGPDRVAVEGARGAPCPARLKVSIGYHAGWIGEGEIGYAGPNALARARLAGETVRERLADAFDEIRIDYIGCTSLHGRAYRMAAEPYEVRLRVAARAPRREQAERVGEEVEALWTNGPAGGGGARRFVREQIGIVSTLIERERVRPGLSVFESSDETTTA